MSDLWAIYDSTNPQLASTAENLQAPTFVLDFTPHVHGILFKFRFSNALTTSATAAGYVQAPFRIVDIQPEWVERDGDQMITTLNSGNGISELS